jgi:hypothetical protein
MRDNNAKLEDKLYEVERYYKDIIHGISEKQVKTRLFIRKALVDLQEALSQLDLNPSQPMIDSRMMGEFADMMAQSNELADEYRSRKNDASTVIHNIENVHIQLASTPKLDRFFDEYGLGQKGDEAGEGQPEAPSGDDLAQLLEEAWSGAETGEPGAEAGGAPQPRGGGGGEGGQAGGQPPQIDSPSGGMPPGGQRQPPQGMGQGPGGGGSPGGGSPMAGTPPAPSALAGKPASQTLTGAPVMTLAAPSQPQDQKFRTEEDLILRESPNLAPYDWDMLPIASPLLHFRRMLNSAKKAEAQQNYIKAINIYQAIMQQRTIQENDLARNILKDQLEALDRLARSQISLNPKRRDIERYFGQDKNKMDRL